MPKFPISYSQVVHISGMDIDETINVVLYEDGHIVVNFHTHEELDLKGGHVAVAVLLYGTPADQSTPINIWTLLPIPRYGVDGKWIGTSDRDDAVTGQVDKDSMSLVSYIAVRVDPAPNDIGQDIQNWVDAASHDFNAALPFAKALSGGSSGGAHS